MTSLIQATLGLDTSDFQTKAKAAEKDLKGFAEGVGNIGKVFTAGGTITAVASFFSQVVSAARESKDNLDANVQAVRRFGDSLDEAKGMASSASIAVVGAFNRIGESVGEAARGTFEFLRGNFDGWKQSNKAAEESAAALADTQKRMKELNDTLKERQGIERQLEAIKEKALTNEEKINYWAEKQAEAQEKLEAGGLKLVEQKRLELEVAQAGQKMDEARAAHNKENQAWMAEQLKKTLAEQAEIEKVEKARAKTNELIAHYAEQDEDARRKTYSIESQIMLASRDLIKTKRELANWSGDEEGKQKLITRQHDQQLELLELNTRMEAARADAASATAGEQAAVTHELAKQAELREQSARWDLQGPDLMRASEAEIKDWMNQMNSRVKQNVSAQFKNQMVGGSASSAGQYVELPGGKRVNRMEYEQYYSPFAQQAQQAQQALEQRGDFARAMSSGWSDDRLARQFGGYQNVENLKRNMGPQDDGARASTLLENIDRKLANAGFRG